MSGSRRSHAAARLVPLVVCFLLSGAAALVYETAWTEEFVLVFGASELAVVCVLAAFMGGSAIGAAAIGRRLHRIRRPLLAYAVLEACIAAGALAVPALVNAAGRLQAVMLGGLLPPEAGSPATVAFHFVTAFLILLPPTAAMGATLPLLARQAVESDDTITSRVGLLYAANTLGAAAGTLVTAFVLLPRLGLGRSVLVGVAANVLAFAVAGATVMRRRHSEPEVSAPAPPDAVSTGTRAVLPLVSASGALSFAGEILWTRLLTHVLGGSVYAFGTMLASYLLGLSVGAAIGARLGRSIGRARHTLAGALVLAGVATVAAPLLLEARVARRTDGIGAAQPDVAACALTIFPVALAIGMVVPCAIRLRAGSAGSAGHATAEVLAWNTVGCVAGALVGGLWLLPRLGFAGSVAALAGGGLLLAALAWLVIPPRRGAWAAAAGIAAAGLVWWAPPTPWAILRSSPLAARPAGAFEDPDPVAFLAVGRGATVLALDEGAEWRLTTNGLPEAAIQRPGARPSRYAIARMLSLLPVAARPEARSMLVVGLGGGTTVEDIPASVRRIDVVELEREVVRANRSLLPRRRDPLADPRVRLVVNDARSALLLATDRYDAIVSQPSHPWTSGASHLFTREFFSLARERMSPGGVLVQWIGLHFVDELLARSLITTLNDVFAYVEVYRPYPGGALLFLSSDQPFDMERVASRAVAADPGPWALAGIQSGTDVLAARLLDAAGAKALAAGAPVNSDHRNLVQSRSPRILAKPLIGADADRLFAPFDSVRTPPASRGVALVRRLLDQREPARALRAAVSLRSSEARDCSYGLVDLAAGRVPRGRGTLLEILRRRPARSATRIDVDEDDEEDEVLAEAGYGLLLSLGRDRDAEQPAGLAEWVAGQPIAGALWTGWRLVREERGREIESLDPLLELARPGHPAYRPATRLRVAWRSAVREPQRAREALALLDPLLAAGASPADLLLRARLAVFARDLDSVLASLYELGPLLREGTALRAEVLRVLESLPEDERRRPGPTRLRSRVESLPAATRPGAAPTSQEPVEPDAR